MCTPTGKVKKGTLRAFSELNYNILASWEIDFPENTNKDPDINWHRGVYIAVIKK